ncbi:MAG TPA: sensor histidine kinase [Candidatus Mediterraneibacter cottocaccae]|nr:sensor histidine kinase [Candidatus Mediterraneibacter cottocaccae]
MTFGEYLRDHVYHILIWLLMTAVTEGVLLLFGSIPALSVFVLGILLCGGAGILAYDFLRKAAFYNDMAEKMEHLKEKYLFAEMQEEPRFLEGKIWHRNLEDISKSMNDEIARHERVSSEFKEYTERWIHEIKIPIASAKLILHNSRGESRVSDESGENSRRLKEQIGRIESDVEKVLYYIRSEVPRNDYRIGEHTLREIVREAVRENKDSLILNRFSVQMEIREEKVYTDRKWLVFMLGQMISNSVKYAREEKHGDFPGSGKSDTGRVIRFRAETKADRIRLFVEDNGIGISTGDLPRIFDKSFTGENGRKTAASTGMGLYICRKLCTEMGHCIGAESEPGAGTRIIVEFGTVRL